MVSVVMAAYDAERYVGDAVRSVVDQTYGDWELIVVDDGSRDGTAAVVEAVGDARVRLLRIPHSGVLGRVRNVGIAAAAGDVVAFLDADDEWLPQKLERQCALLDRDPAIGVVHAAADLRAGDRRMPGPRGAATEPLVRRLLESNFVFSSSAVVRQSLLERYGAFDPDPALAGSPDYDLWLRLAPHTRFAYVDEPLLLYRVHAAQMSGDDAAMHESALVVLEKLRARAPELVAAEAAAFSFAVGMHRQLARRPDRGRPDLLRALRARPLYRLAWRWLARSLRTSA